MFLLGIDGGGSHTRAELRTMDNRLLRRLEFGSLNLAVLGKDRFCLQLRELFSACGNMSECTSLCLGMAGISAGPAKDLLVQELERAGFCGRLTLLGDHEIALAGAMQGPGCVLICGTGSICCGRNEAGTFARCGGLGHLLGDEGSGYAIGREALSLTAKALDEQFEMSSLARAVMEAAGAKDLADLLRYVYSEERGKAHIAALAPVVIACADRKDPESLALLRRQAEQLRPQVEALAHKLSIERPRLALLGGLLMPKNSYRSLVEQALSSCAELVEPEHDALWGAAELAYLASR
ncbi:MAG: hypothetical protein MJ135_03820 [Oscillospiraceae bacterium]|nr:hypothetical protein [Oscillospiraceae bacterium]